ncbi:ABC transporter permease subunit [Mycobacterium spongiae]|uniref:ABC transporter permease subunit n=1 Tax=Mycobacterium spongiae TaxID=886343 RepID=A0A975PXP5_9MYCO|nr:ABC transporter permease subunit [Mycobacterium spongiae]QUR68039.1 ABC transporter permease subunit [Mycobacterium spongiae]
MATETTPVLTGVLREQRRQVVLWCVALAVLSAMYISFYPSMSGSGVDALIENMPEQLTTALGYDRLGTAAGWLTSTVYGLVGPVLLLVFAIAAGSRLIAGAEESGVLELEATSAVTRREIFVQRLLALWLTTLLLVVVIMLVSYGLVLALAMNVSLGNIVAASIGLFLLVTGMGTVALAVGAVTGRRAVALGVAAALAVLAYVFDALGPVVGAGWMTAISPFSWYLDSEPLANGFDLPGLVLLALIPIVSTAIGLRRFERRDLMV